MKGYRKSHDLSLPSWGPYSKRYVGISHIPSPAGGKRFDLCVFPALYRRGVTVPSVMWESGYHPWDCSPDLTRYTHRHELLWKDRIYTDISFSLQDESHALFSCRSVNNTGDRQALVFHLMNALHFPPLETYSREPVREAAPPRGEGIYFTDALDYDKLIFKEDSPQRNLSPDGTLWGEIRAHGLTGGSGLGGGFGAGREDAALYSLPPLWDRKGKVYVRFRAAAGEDRKLHFQGGLEGDVAHTASGDWELLPVGLTAKSGETFTFTTAGSGEVDLDGFLFCPSDLTEEPYFTPIPLNPEPHVLPGPGGNSLLLKYEGIDSYYGLGWDIPAVVRHWECDEPDNLMKHNVHEHNHRLFRGEGDGHFTEVFTRPIYLEPSSEQTNRGIVCCGTRDEVESLLRDFSRGEKASLPQEATGEARPFTGEDEYAFSVNRLAATSLMNVVYPVRVQGEWIRHHTPGRWWDCLYTWDSGFIGLGFTALDLKRAEETLSTYLTLPGNPHAAFIHHGSPVPTQFLLYQELFNRSHSTEILARYYDSLLQYHRFMAGRLGSSSTGVLKSGLLKTWDYFYNSGGWDDYCPQVHVRQESLEERAAPAITTAMAIRTALILKGAARILGRETEELDRDIEELSGALQAHSWDGETGYFAYVMHDEAGRAVSQLKDETGINFDMGFDGAYPLNSGTCTEEQEASLMEKLFSPDRLWTDTGLTAIDQSAPYFRDDGYWNGAVWMAHQWIFWKTMLDLGRGDEAWQIARTALELWKRETEDTYFCFEHFITSSGRGAGWHHFGGLSSPLLNWYASYFVPGRLTAGHDTWIRESRFSRNFDRADFTLMTTGYGSRDRTVLAVLNPKATGIRAFLDGKPLPCHVRRAGTVEITLPAGTDDSCRITLEGTL